MSVTEQFTISRGQARAAARALNRLADSDAVIDRDQLLSELKRVGFKGKMPAPDKRATPPYGPLGDDATPKGSGRASLPPPGGPPLIWVRPKAAARMAGIGLTLLYRWVAAGRVVTKRIGGVRLVYVPSIHALTDDGTNDATG